MRRGKLWCQAGPARILVSIYSDGFIYGAAAWIGRIRDLGMVRHRHRLGSAEPVKARVRWELTVVTPDGDLVHTVDWFPTRAAAVRAAVVRWDELHAARRNAQAPA